MAKRFTDTEKFSDTWYRKLSLLHKVIWEYLLAECNHAGILENFDLEMMSFKIGAQVKKEDLEVFCDRIIFISENVLFIPKFIEFQYGELNPQSKVHASVLKELKRYSIDRVSIEYAKGSLTPKDKDKEEDKDILNQSNCSNRELDSSTLKEKEKQAKEKESESVLQGLEDWRGEYCNVHLTDKQYGKLLSMIADEKLLDSIIKALSENIARKKSNAPPYDENYPEMHFVAVKKYWDYRKTHPGDFKACDKESQTSEKKAKSYIMAEVFDPNTEQIRTDIAFEEGVSQEEVLEEYQKVYGGEGWKFIRFFSL